jgi:hypothetical protein
MSNNQKGQEAIVLKNSVYHSYRGEYFLGQTEIISYSGDFMAWGGLFNPPNSNVELYLNAYTVTNLSEQAITAEGWLGGSFSGRRKRSENYAAGNQTFDPPRQPKVIIQSASYVTETPSGGSLTFVRRIEAGITLTKHDFQGMYIIPPGSSFVLFFLPPGNTLIHAKLAFGWWEEASEIGV